jgi:D-tyrosyl-tRNA(Tyr) deacylase
MIMAENMFNEPPGAGKQVFMVTFEVTYHGPDSVETGGGYG